VTSVPGETDATADPAPVGAASPAGPARRLGLALFLVSAAQFVLQLDFSIVNVALATIQRELGVSAVDLQWIVTGYALPFGALLLLGGRLGDLTGHRRLLAAGLVLFGLTSLAAGLAPDAIVLIAARFAQGASAALVAPMTLAAVTDLYHDGPGRARALGIFQGATAAGASAGIVLGGILTEFVGWRSIFLVNPPVIAVLVVAIIRLLPGDGAERAAAGRRPRLDVAGAVLVTTAVAALIFGLSQGQQRGFGAPLTLASLTAAVLLGAGFVGVERRAPAPMVPLAVFADRSRRVALGVMFAASSVIVGYVYFVTLYLQKVLHFSALQAGLGLLPATLTVMTASTLLARRLLARFGALPVFVTALVSLGLGQAWLSMLSATGSYPVNVLPGIVLTAFGMGLLFPTAAGLATAGVRAADRGLAGGLFAAAQQVGMALGLAVLATIAAARTRSAPGLTAVGALVHGYQAAYLVATGIVACALLATLLFLRTGHRDGPPADRQPPPAPRLPPPTPRLPPPRPTPNTHLRTATAAPATATATACKITARSGQSRAASRIGAPGTNVITARSRRLRPIPRTGRPGHQWDNSKKRRAADTVPRAADTVPRAIGAGPGAGPRR
jgi:MFS family permease